MANATLDQAIMRGGFLDTPSDNSLSPSTKGRLYFNTDFQTLFYDTGEEWVVANAIPEQAAMISFLEGILSEGSNVDLVFNAEDLFVEIGATTQVRPVDTPLDKIDARTVEFDVAYPLSEPSGGIARVGLPSLGSVVGITPVEGDLLYYDGAAWVTVPVGSEGDVLTLVGTVPTWVAP